MDSLRGGYAGYENADSTRLDPPDADDDAQLAALGADERRMQVRAYNFWASLLGDRIFPDVADLKPAELPDFGPKGVLLDFAEGIENPLVTWVGAELAAESGLTGTIHRLNDVPGRSLLSRITDHYLQILGNQAPIGFEAEFENQRGVTILYRGILLPFSRSGTEIECVYGVINWKELSGDQSGQREMPQARFGEPTQSPPAWTQSAIHSWADGPVDPGAFGLADEPGYDGAMNLAFNDAPYDLAGEGAPMPATDLGIGDRLATARECAQVAIQSEDRSRRALYAAIGCAYDFALAALDAPADLAELAQDAGIAMQERAPLTPIVKLVFGATYDKTRIAEIATVIAHGQRLGLEMGAMAQFLGQAQGGIKSVVRAERRMRSEEHGGLASGGLSPTAHERIVERLRALEPRPLSSVGQNAEFTVLVARRYPDGRLALLGEVCDDDALLDKVAQRLLG